MLFTDSPARIAQPGTFPFTTKVGAVYTVGRDHVQDAMASVFQRSRSISGDIETFGVGEAGRRIKSCAFGHGGHSVVIDPRDPRQEFLVQKITEHATELIFHNSMFDIPNMYLNGLIRLEDVDKVTDTLIYLRLAEPGDRVRKNLGEACERHLATPGGDELAKAFKALGLTKRGGFRMFDLDRPIYLQGAASDPLMTWRLKDVARNLAYQTLTSGHPFMDWHGVSGAEAWELVEREQRINRMLLKRACLGLRVDFEYLDQYREKNALEVAEAEVALKAAGVRPGNGNDLARVLDEAGAIPPDHPRTPTGKLQMTAGVLEKITHPVARQFTAHKQIQKVDKDYLDKCVQLALNGRVYPTTGLLAAVTGRGSMGDPPIHQFPPGAREIILADEGDSLTSIDLSQGEPITIANAARDYEVVEAYESGVSDVYTHLGVVSKMLPAGTVKADCPKGSAFGKVRDMLKVAVLAQLYGEGLAKLSADLGMSPEPYTYPSTWEVEHMGHNPEVLYPRYGQAKTFRNQVLRAMPKTDEFMNGKIIPGDYEMRAHNGLKHIAREHRKMVTISGRILPIPVGRFGVEAHKGVNYFCQGGQYDLIADALIRIIDAGLGDAVYFTMHDELIVSTSAAEDIRRILTVPAERLTLWAGGRVPKLITDMEHMGERWKSV